MKPMRDMVVLRKDKNMVTRVIDDETILLPIYKSSDEMNCIYTLNKVASRIWDLIDGRSSVSSIKKRALKEFDTTPEEMNKELQKLLKDLKKIKAIV